MTKRIEDCLNDVLDDCKLARDHVTQQHVVFRTTKNTWEAQCEIRFLPEVFQRMFIIVISRAERIKYYMHVS